VTTIWGRLFTEHDIRHFSLEDRNQHFCVSGQFLLDFHRASLIAYFGNAATVTIPPEIEVICDCCFVNCRNISWLEFEPGSQLRRIERMAFGMCLSLHTICIPSTIQALEREWFLLSHYHGVVVFDTVQFESAESLAEMVVAGSADLNSDFDIEVMNWDGEVEIPGYDTDVILSPDLVRLKKT
jgi:hypothetical protein